MLAYLFAAALAASPIPALDPKDPKARTAICAVNFIDNIKRVAAGDAPTSFDILLFAQAHAMSDADEQVLETECKMFDKGALFAFSVTHDQASKSAEPEDDDDGEAAPDHSDEPV